MLSGGKQGTLYLVDRDNMGRFHADDDSQIVQSLTKAVNLIFCSPVYWQDKVYIAAFGDYLKVFNVDNGLLSTAPVSKSANLISFPGATPVISANGPQDGIVWLMEHAAFRYGKPLVLHAYDASDVSHELYNSEQAGARDALSIGTGFGVPTVANGKVYLGSLSELAVFGPLP
jgi:hypothetical protein